MKPFSQQTLNAIIQFAPRKGKFYVKTQRKWFLFKWWNTVGTTTNSYWNGTVFTPIYFETKEYAESYCQRMGFTLV